MKDIKKCQSLLLFDIFTKVKKKEKNLNIWITLVNIVQGFTHLSFKNKYTRRGVKEIDNTSANESQLSHLAVSV